MNRTCSVEDCGSRVLAKGWCAKHYNRQLRTGSVESKRDSGRAICVVDGCSRFVAAYGFCHNHKRRSPEYQARAKALVMAKRKGRSCFHCGSAIPLERPSDAIYCSRECKVAQRNVDGRQREAALRCYFKTQYGITPEWVDEAAVNGCQICGTFEWGGRHNRPNVDHCHKTGRVRGVLCSECNNGIGKLKDDPVLLQKAIDYLTRSLS